MLRTAGLADATTAVGDCHFALTSRRRDWLEHLDRDPTPLLEHLAARSGTRLGLYFEALWHFFLDRDEQTSLVAHNLAVRNGGTTVGEFDCIYYCHKRQQHIHLELAVKYYLAWQRGSSTQWLGPNARDRLDLKLAHLLQRQILLADCEEGKAALAQFGVLDVAKEIALRGYLFQAQREALPYPAGYRRGEGDHYWVHQNHLQEYLNSQEEMLFLPLERLRWLSPAVAGAGDRLFSAQELLGEIARRFQALQQPALVAALSQDNIERRRFFVVPEQWPQGGPV